MATVREMIFSIFGNKLRYATRSPKWKSVRKQHLDNHNFCAACGKQKDLEVHHIVPVHLNPDLELDPNNLITLCANSCHILFGHLMDFRSWNENVVKDCNDMSKKISNRPYKLGQ